MNVFSKMILQLDLYKDTINEIVRKYQDEDAAIKARLLPAVYQTEHQVLVEKYRAQISDARDKKTTTLNDLLNDVQRNLKVWTSQPVGNERLLESIKSAHEVGVKFTAEEIETFADSLNNSHMGRRILQELAKESGVKLPEKVVSTDVYIDALKGAKLEAEIFLKYFCGEKMLGAELLPESDRKSPLLGIALTGKPFRSDSRILQAAAIFGDGKVPTGSRGRFTVSDKEILDKMLSGCATRDEKKHRVQELISQNEDLKSFFILSDETKVFVKELEKD